MTDRNKLEEILGKRMPQQQQEEDKLAAPGGLLEAYYEQAEKIAEEVGLDRDEAFAIAEDAMGTKVAYHAMMDEAERIQTDRALAVTYDPALEKAASYAPPSGAEAGILMSLYKRLENE